MMKKRVDIVVGTRPNVVKAAPLCRTLLEHTTCDPHLVVVHQQTDERMLLGPINDFGLHELVPLNHLKLEQQAFNKREDRLHLITGLLMEHWRSSIPDSVVVIGDVDTTVSAARAAHRLQIPLIHLEAGLRSDNPDMPEEHNRIEADRLSDLLLVTKPYAVDRLVNEGVEEEHISLTGNVALDALTLVEGEHGIVPGQVLVTMHRQENVDKPKLLEKIPNLLLQLASLSWVTKILFPVHPRTKMRLEEANLWTRLNRIEKLNCVAPLPYHEFIGQIRKAELILTDSGGVQEEAFQIGKPCVVLRTETEHKHALESNLFHLCPLADACKEILPLIKRLRSTGMDLSENDIEYGQASKNAALAIEKFMHKTVRQT